MCSTRLPASESDERRTAARRSSFPARETGCGPRGAGVSIASFDKVVLFTDADGRARFRDETIALTEGSAQAMLSPLSASGGYQLRHSPVGFRSPFHCTVTPQWVFILGGVMEIGLQDGSVRRFEPGSHFYSADLLPPGASFDASIHGHWSRQHGSEPLVTLFVRD